MRREAGIHRFRCPRHQSRLGLFAMEAQRPRQWRLPVPQSEQKFFLSVKDLTLLDQFLNDAGLRMGGSGAHLANADRDTFCFPLLDLYGACWCQVVFFSVSPDRSRAARRSPEAP